MRVACLLLSAAAPLIALWCATPADRAAQGLAVSPFGWPSLLVVHVFSAVPAAWLLGRVVAARVKPESVGGVLLLAVLVSGIGSLVASEIGSQLESSAMGFTARVVARSVFVLLLALPWCVAANLSLRPGRIDPLAILASAVTAFGVPAVHADRLADQAIAEADAQFRLAHPARAVSHLVTATDLDPARRFPDRETVKAKRTKLASLLAELAKEIDRTAAKPTVQRALMMIALDRLSDAEEQLRPLAQGDPLARLYLGECRQLQSRWTDGDADIRAALVELVPRSASRDAAKDCRKAFDLLAESATKRNCSAEREAVLREALEKLPGQAGYWHMQLGRHFEMNGRPLAALTEFDLAEKQDKSLKSELDAHRRHIAEHTPGCLMR